MLQDRRLRDPHHPKICECKNLPVATRVLHPVMVGHLPLLPNSPHKTPLENLLRSLGGHQDTMLLLLYQRNLRDQTTYKALLLHFSQVMKRDDRSAAYSIRLKGQVPSDSNQIKFPWAAVAVRINIGLLSFRRYPN